VYQRIHVGNAYAVTILPLWRRLAQLDESIEGETRFNWQLPRRRLENEARVFACLDERASAAQHRHRLDRGLCSSRELLVGHGGNRIDRETAEPREIEMDVVFWKIELVEVRTHGVGRKALIPELRNG